LIVWIVAQGCRPALGAVVPSGLDGMQYLGDNLLYLFTLLFKIERFKTFEIKGWSQFLKFKNMDLSGYAEAPAGLNRSAMGAAHCLSKSIK